MAGLVKQNMGFSKDFFLIVSRSDARACSLREAFVKAPRSLTCSFANTYELQPPQTSYSAYLGHRRELKLST